MLRAPPPPCREYRFLLATCSWLSTPTAWNPGMDCFCAAKAAAFVDNLAPDDRVAVLTIPWMKSEVSLSNNREAAKTALVRPLSPARRKTWSVEYSIGLWRHLRPSGTRT